MGKEYTSYLVTSLEKIKKEFNDFQVSQSTEMHHYFLSLPEDEKSDYIGNFENFYHSFGSLFVAFDDLLFLSKKLEDIKIERNIYFEKTKSHPPADFFAEGSFQNIAPLVRFLFNSIAILVKIIEDNKILKYKKIKKDYKELHYVRLLRNNFIQHIGLDDGYQKVSSSAIPNSSSKDLPDCHVGPGGGGWAFYTGYYQKVADTEEYQRLSNIEKLSKNKENFVNYGKWLHIVKGNNKKTCGILIRLKFFINNKKIKGSKSIEAQIKTYGLPKIDQKILAEDLTNLFNNVILGLLEKENNQAKKDKILS